MDTSRQHGARREVSVLCGRHERLHHVRAGQHLPSDGAGANTPRGVQLTLILAGMSFGTLVALHTSLAGTHTFNAMRFRKAADRCAPKDTRRACSEVRVYVPGPGVRRRLHERSADGGRAHDAAHGGSQSLRACVALQKTPEVVDSTSTFCQMLFMMSSVDHVTSLSLAVERFDKMQDKDKQFKVFDGLYHALFDDLDKSLVFEFLLDWLHARLPEPMIVHSGSA
ncbi:hypothetical protein FI667_g13963, partial [Globisporangium splendens]